MELIDVRIDVAIGIVRAVDHNWEFRIGAHKRLIHTKGDLNLVDKGWTFFFLGWTFLSDVGSPGYSARRK